VILSTSVVPGTPTDKDGRVPIQTAGKVAIACKFLEGDDVFDVDCELKESEVCRYAGRTLVPPYRYLNPAVDLRVSFTLTIGTYTVSIQDKE
jgi:hypothetical protein